MQGKDRRNKFSAVSRESQGSKASRSARPYGTASLLLELLADVPRRCLLPRKEFVGVHGGTITRQGKSPTQGVPAEQNLVRGQSTRSVGVTMGLQGRPHLLRSVSTWVCEVNLA